MTYCVKAVRVLAMFVIFVVCCVGEDDCKRASYTKVMLGITDTNHTCAEFTLKKNFDEWKFSENLLLSLPCEQNEDNSIREVGNVIFSKVRPTPLKKGVQLAAFSGDALRSVLDMNTAVVKTRGFLFMASGWDTVPDTTPLSHRYGGHQFGVWAGQLGDGRAHLLGQYVNRFGERWELQLKGSGRTPYSRGGDGRAVIRSSVREFLCSEAMHFLGIPTSRAASLVVSDDRVMRDRFYDGSPRPERAAVVLRLAKSWFRFGSFEILARSGEIPLLRQLADFIIEHHFPDIPSNDTDRYAMLYQSVVEDTAHLVAKWQSVGFTHGVCNTDNFSILSFTIDYGPFRFMDAYDPDMVPNTSDDERRYSYKKQPDVAYYNLDKLREAIQVLLPVEQHFVLRQILNGFMDRYKSYYVELFCKKLGFLDVEDTDQYLIASLLDIMADVKADFTMTFRHLSEWNLDTSQLEGSSSNLWTLNQLWSHENFRQWLQLYKDRLSNSNIEEAERRQVMLAANPRYVPRNWIIEQIIDQVEEDTFDLLQKTLELFKNPYNYQKEAEELGYADQPPAWAKQIKVSCSS